MMVPLASRQWHTSVCHISLGSDASKRTNDVLGRFFGAGSINLARCSSRLIVEGDTVTS